MAISWHSAVTSDSARDNAWRITDPVGPTFSRVYVQTGHTLASVALAMVTSCKATPETAEAIEVHRHMYATRV